MKHCSKCKREKTEAILDTSCAQGGYCEWEEEEEKISNVNIEPLGLPPRTRIISSNYVHSRRVEAVCPFEWTPSLGCFSAMPQLIFRPEGLIIWGAPPLSSVEQIKVGNREQLTVSYGHLPARFFGSGDNFAAIMKLLAEGKEYPSWGTWDTCEVGNILRLFIRDRDKQPLGPDDDIELLVWGVTSR